MYFLFKSHKNNGLNATIRWCITASFFLMASYTFADVGIDTQGRVWVWDADNLPKLVEGLPKTQALSSFNGHHLALDVDGELWVWGRNDSAQLGLGHFSPVPKPQPIGIKEKFVSVATTEFHTVALDKSGRIWVWGANPRGQLGNAAASSLTIETRPIALSIPFRARSIGASNIETATTDEEGQTWIWGGVNAGQYPSPKKIAQPPRWLKAQNPAIHLLSGRIQQSSGKPVAKAEVIVGKKVCARTLADGQFLCAVPASLSGELRVRSSEWLFSKSLKLPVDSDRPNLSWVAEPLSTVPNRSDNKPATETPIVMTKPAANKNSIPMSTPRAEGNRKSQVILSGWVRTGSGSASGLGGAIVQGRSAQCSATDETGRFHCQVPIGWNGTLFVSKPGYRFSPSTISVSAVQDDDPEIQTFRAYFEGRQ